MRIGMPIGFGICLAPSLSFADQIALAASLKAPAELEQLERLFRLSAKAGIGPERVDFVRAEAKRAGRDPYSIKISVLPNPMIADSPAAARQTIEMMS